MQTFQSLQIEFIICSVNLIIERNGNKKLFHEVIKPGLKSTQVQCRFDPRRSGHAGLGQIFDKCCPEFLIEEVCPKGCFGVMRQCFGKSRIPAGQINIGIYQVF